MSETSQNVELLLAERKKQLASEVAAAISNAPLANYDNGKIIEPDDDFPESRRTIVDTIHYSPKIKPNMVVLHDYESHLYLWLLAEVMRQIGYSNPKEMIATIKEKVDHESAHFAHSLAYDGITSRRLAVSILKIETTEGTAWAFIACFLLGGESKREEFLEIINAPARIDQPIRGSDKDYDDLLKNREV